MRNITKNDAIDEIKNLFNDCDDLNCSGGQFLVKKSELPRSEVVSRLRGHFDGVNIVGGQLSLISMTMVFTSFGVEDRG